LRASYQSKRDRMLDALKSGGFKVLKPQGSYFVMVDWRGVASAKVHDDMQFAEWLIREIGIACIPASPFYQRSDKHLGKNFARFAVCKKDETLDAAAQRLLQLAR